MIVCCCCCYFPLSWLLESPYLIRQPALQEGCGCFCLLLVAAGRSVWKNQNSGPPWNVVDLYLVQYVVTWWLVFALWFHLRLVSASYSQPVPAVHIWAQSQLRSVAVCCKSELSQRMILTEVGFGHVTFQYIRRLHLGMNWYTARMELYIFH